MAEEVKYVWFLRTPHCRPPAVRRFVLLKLLPRSAQVKFRGHATNVRPNGGEVMYTDEPKMLTDYKLHCNAVIQQANALIGRVTQLCLTPLVFAEPAEIPADEGKIEL